MNVKVSVSGVKIGNVVIQDGKLFKTIETKHVKPGKGGAFIQMELKGVDSETKLNKRFRSGETIEKATLEEKNAKFLYEENGMCIFMLMDDSYEQFEIQKNKFKPMSDFLQNEAEIKAIMHEDRVISFEFANPLIMEIIEADPVLKGQTAASSYKNAVLENGIKILVPTYIKQGDKVIIDPSEFKYKERYND